MKQKPEINYKQISNVTKLQFMCECSQELNKCNLILLESQYVFDCANCPLNSVENYKAWKKQNPKPQVFKWPMRDKEHFFVMPRIAMNFMPNSWKKKMVKLLNEFESFNFLDLFKEDIEHDNRRGLRVSVTQSGKYTKMPEIFKKY